jgi:hypothetical protein
VYVKRDGKEWRHTKRAIMGRKERMEKADREEQIRF